MDEVARVFCDFVAGLAVFHVEHYDSQFAAAPREPPVVEGARARSRSTAPNQSPRPMDFA
jgi:hypothetical protein